MMAGFQGWRFGGCWVGLDGGDKSVGEFWWWVSVMGGFADGAFQWWLDFRDGNLVVVGLGFSDGVESVAGFWWRVKVMGLDDGGFGDGGLVDGCCGFYTSYGWWVW